MNHTPGCRTRIESAISADPHRPSRYDATRERLDQKRKAEGQVDSERSPPSPGAQQQPQKSVVSTGSAPSRPATSSVSFAAPAACDDRIVSDIERRCGGCSLHRVVRARLGGEPFLEAAGRRAMLPPEDEVPPNPPDAISAEPVAVEAADPGALPQVSLVTVNVDGMGNYALSPDERIAAILEEVLRTRPNVVLMQEVTVEIQAHLGRLAGAQET